MIQEQLRMRHTVSPQLFWVLVLVYGFPADPGWMWRHAAR